MSEPNTVNVGLVVPNTGDLSGSWGTSAVNLNMTALDGMLGGVQSFSLSSGTTFALTLPSGSLTPGAGPNQSQNALIKLTGTLTGNAQIQFGMPGKYIIFNQCTVGSFFVQLAPTGGTGSGNGIGAPPGEMVTVFYDGTSMNYVDMGRVGSALDLHGVTTYPAWMNACTVKPFLIKDGTVYTTSVYPALSALLGSTFGGNGITTFAVPDESGRMRMAYDSASTGRVTNAGSGIAATTMGAAGGNQFLQSHTHTNTVNDPSHSHGIAEQFTLSGSGSTINSVGGGRSATIQTDNATTNITVTISSTGAGGSQNMPPTIVSFLALIRAG